MTRTQAVAGIRWRRPWWSASSLWVAECGVCPWMTSFRRPGWADAIMLADRHARSHWSAAQVLNDRR